MKFAKYEIQILEEFEERDDDWKLGDFETRLSEISPNSSYHDAKNIIWKAEKAGLYPKTVKRYNEGLERLSSFNVE